MTVHTSPNRRSLDFSSDAISVMLVENVSCHAVEGRRIILNLGHDDIVVVDEKPQAVSALQSTILINADVLNVQRAIEISIPDKITMRSVIDDLRWARFADLVADPSGVIRQIPLFRSSQDSVGSSRWHGDMLGVVSASPKATRLFEVKVNLWFAPAGTDCMIHRQHSFVETHLQVYGIGRMQKFYSERRGDMYEEIIMTPGLTQPFFKCAEDGHSDFMYPWHQYYADTDCVWLAIEFHPSDVAP